MSFETITVRPLKDAPDLTLGRIEDALGMFLSATVSEQLDSGQRLMVDEARRRVEQVTHELRVL